MFKVGMRVKIKECCPVYRKATGIIVCVSGWNTPYTYQVHFDNPGTGSDAAPFNASELELLDKMSVADIFADEIESLTMGRDVQTDPDVAAFFDIRIKFAKRLRDKVLKALED